MVYVPGILGVSPKLRIAGTPNNSLGVPLTTYTFSLTWVLPWVRVISTHPSVSNFESPAPSNSLSGADRLPYAGLYTDSGMLNNLAPVSMQQVSSSFPDCNLTCYLGSIAEGCSLSSGLVTLPMTAGDEASTG